MRTRTVITLVAVVVGSFGSGCLSWVIPDPPSPESASDASSPSDLAPGAGPADLAGAGGAGGGGAGGGGGATAAVGFADVQAGLDQKGCTASGCHGGLQTPQLKPAPATDADKMANYNAFKSGCVQGKCVDAASPAASLMLKKPLADDGLTHAGGKLFADFNDAVYVKWLAWIQAGAPY
jgi:hypothetical protein